MNLVSLVSLAVFSPVFILWMVAGVLIVSALVMWLWNITVPEVFGLKRIQYWQALRLWLIVAVLVGAGGLL